MTQQIKNIYIVVEGSSEKSFFTKLNSYCSRMDIPVSFKIENAEGHTLKKVLDAVKKAGKKIKKDLGGVLTTDVMVFLDYDVFKRGEDIAPYNARLKRLYFFEYSFEDFLVSLLPTEESQKWKRICEEQGHYQSPMNATAVESHIKAIFPHYRKGDCPLYEITEEHVRRMPTTNFHEDIQHAELLLLRYVLPPVTPKH
ncbi:MAG: hypothetical protein IKN49_00860 [Elusimicrobiaceae bacterium]|nr:hypothetical protein [Elusimicrobiaceae bacterium]